MKLLTKLSSITKPSLSVLAIGIFGFLGAHYLGIGSAATTYNHNPQAGVDTCALVGNTTVLYGWAADADAPAGPQPYLSVKVGTNAAVTVTSNIVGYRDAAVNAYIRHTNPGAPTSSIYGWQLQIGGLYKGGSYAISGTVLNYGSGANIGLPVDTDHSVETGKIYFNPDKTIPDACLATKAAPPIVTPTPPPPVKIVPKSPIAPVIPATPTTSSANDAVATIGTTTVSFMIPAGNATSLYVLYGTDPTQLNRSSDIQTLTGPSASVTLQKLTAKTTYTYKIMRTLSGQTVASAATSFTTKGYDLTLVFNNSAKQGVAGITATLDKQKQTSDKTGKLSFSNLPSGNYSPIFNYKGQNYTEDYATGSAPDSDQPTTISLEHTVNVDTLKTGGNKNVTPIANKHSPLLIIIVAALVLVLAAGAWWFIRRRRNMQHTDFASTDYLKPVIPAALSPEVPTVSATPLTPAHPVAPAPEHMGESLRDMVIESMAAEQALPHKDRPKPPIVPGQQ